MTVRFARKYIDSLFADADLMGLYHVVGVLERKTPLPDRLWLFCRLLEWAPARSGIWQYYNGLSVTKFERMARALEDAGLTLLAEKYRIGRTTPTDPDQGDSLDKWLDCHEQQINHEALGLAQCEREWINAIASRS